MKDNNIMLAFILRYINVGMYHSYTILSRVLEQSHQRDHYLVHLVFDQTFLVVGNASTQCLLAKVSTPTKHEQV